MTLHLDQDIFVAVWKGNWLFRYTAPGWPLQLQPVHHLPGGSWAHRGEVQLSTWPGRGLGHVYYMTIVLGKCFFWRHNVTRLTQLSRNALRYGSALSGTALWNPEKETLQISLRFGKNITRYFKRTVSRTFLSLFFNKGCIAKTYLYQNWLGAVRESVPKIIWISGPVYTYTVQWTMYSIQFTVLYLQQKRDIYRFICSNRVRLGVIRRFSCFYHCLSWLCTALNQGEKKMQIRKMKTLFVHLNFTVKTVQCKINSSFCILNHIKCF